MENNKIPIGVIDSGFGGLSVLRHLLVDLPDENFVYFADNDFCPYGRRRFEEIQDRICFIVDYLIREYNVKLIVVACNTATAAAIDLLREKFNIPFIGMEPAIKPAALNTKTGIIGVLATEGTFNGRLFKQTKQKYASDIQVIIKAGNGLVELVEKGITTGNEVEELLYQYITPMVKTGADLLVLGCTHYPFLSETIIKLFPTLQIIDPAPAVSKQTVSVLTTMHIKNKKKKNRSIVLLTSALCEDLQSFSEKVLGQQNYTIQKVFL